MTAVMFGMAGDILTLSSSPTCQPPIPSQRMCFLSTLAVSAIGLTVQPLLGSLGLRGTPSSSYLLRMNFFFLFPCSSSLELVTEHVSTIACPVQCRVGCTEKEIVLGKILCGFGLWHLRWASSIRVVIGGDVSKTRKGQALMSVSVSKHKGRNQALGP